MGKNAEKFTYTKSPDKNDMPDFRTTLKAQKAPFSISHQDHLLCLGSCFAQHIGTRLQNNHFSTVLNPFGILYNPASIAHALQQLLRQKKMGTSDLFQNQGIWYSFAHHGHFSDPDPELALQKINEASQEGQQQLQKTTRLLITLGTAQVFQYKASGQIVANCHKLPAKEFRELEMSATEITQLLSPIFQQLSSLQPDLQIILSLSPIRHLRNGLINNQRSKAKLLSAIHDLVDRHDWVSYFPAYEIVLDDLRDYRFYEADLIHPNDQAINYIWTFFGDTFFDEPSKNLNKQLAQLQKAITHRPFHPQSEAHQQFIQQQLQNIQKMERQYPFLDLKTEKQDFEQQLVK